MKTITWGAIGCGDVCERKSGPPLYQVDGCELKGVHRRDPDKGRDFAKRHNDCQYYATADELLADPAITAIYVATHPDTHKDFTLQAAAAGKAVLVEKEMASNAAECTAMIEACRAAGVTLGVAFYRRCYPSMRRVREVIQAGTIGRVKGLRINDQFPLSHRLDLAHYFFGDMAMIRTTTETLPPTSHAAEGQVLYATARQGPVTVMNVGWHESTLVETLVFDGETGTLVVEDLKSGKICLLRGDTVRREDTAGLPYTHWGLIDNFARHLRGHALLACPGEEGRKSQVIEDLVKTLTPDGPTVKVDYAV